LHTLRIPDSSSTIQSIPLPSVWGTKMANSALE
jgi:hypothetical protein